MNKLGLVLGGFSAFFFLAGCASYQDVRPSADGIHNVVVAGESGQQAARSALAQANAYCDKEQNKKKAYIVKEEQKYVGSVDEENYKTGKAVSSVLKTVGGAVTVFGGRNESTVGGVGALGGVATDAALGQGYNVIMQFKCQ